MSWLKGSMTTECSCRDTMSCESLKRKEGRAREDGRTSVEYGSHIRHVDKGDPKFTFSGTLEST